MCRKELAKMRILIIGGTRFMGPLVVRYLHAQGHDITLFHRGQTRVETLPEVQEMLGDRRPLAPHARDLQRLAPDVVLDMVPVIEQDAREIMNTFTGIARRVVAISSQDVYRAFKIVSDDRNLPKPGRRRGDGVRRGLDDHRRIDDTVHICLLCEESFRSSSSRRHIFLLTRYWLHLVAQFVGGTRQPSKLSSRSVNPLPIGFVSGCA